MNLGAKTALLAAGISALLAAQASADGPSPLEQLRQGAEPGDVSCYGGLGPMLSPDGRPACVSASSAGELADRGWSRVLPTCYFDDSGTVGELERRWHMTTEVKFRGMHPLREQLQSGSLDAPGPWPPTLHPNTSLTLSKYPVVGEVVDMVVTTEYRDVPPEFFYRDEHPLAQIDATSRQPDRYRVFDIVANIGTGDEDAFAPYDFTTTTVVAEPGAVYVVKAKLEILREGIADIIAGGFDEDIMLEAVAASRDRSMSYDEYTETGQTYLGDLLPEPCWPEARPFDDYLATPEERERDLYPILGDILGKYYTEPEALELLSNEGFEGENLRRFLVDHMGYSPERIDWLFPDGMLAYAYLREETPERQIIGNLLQRDYPPDSMRAFFIDYLGYTPNQAAGLNIEKDLAEGVRLEEVVWRQQEGYTLDMLTAHMQFYLDLFQRWGYTEDMMREFFVEHAGYTEHEAQTVVAGGPPPHNPVLESRNQKLKMYP